MTKEDAIELVKSAFDIWEDKYSVGNDMSREHKARDMAIKALEEQDSILDVLDKIKAEIVDLGQRTMNDNRASGIWACRDIIDKYKEREGKK